jgi:hypothetical protein
VATANQRVFAGDGRRCPVSRDGRIYFSQPLWLRHFRKARLQALAQSVKAALHAADALK